MLMNHDLQLTHPPHTAQVPVDYIHEDSGHMRAAPSFSFSDLVRISVEAERDAPYVDIGPTDTLCEEDRERAYDAFFGTSPLSSPSPSPPSPSVPNSPSPSQPSSLLAPPVLHLAPTRKSPQNPNPPPQNLLLEQGAPMKNPASKKRKQNNMDVAASASSSKALKLGEESPSAETSGPGTRNKKKGRALRTAKRKNDRTANPDGSRTPKERIFAKYVAQSETTKTTYDVVNIPSASTGFIALPDTGGRVYMLKELVEDRGFALVKWDGR
jgi:hypothetical protein